MPKSPNASKAASSAANTVLNSIKAEHTQHVETLGKAARIMKEWSNVYYRDEPELQETYESYANALGNISDGFKQALSHVEEGKLSLANRAMSDTRELIGSLNSEINGTLGRLKATYSYMGSERNSYFTLQRVKFAMETVSTYADSFYKKIGQDADYYGPFISR